MAQLPRVAPFASGRWLGSGLSEFTARSRTEHQNPLTAAITVLALGVTPMANAQNKGCSNATLKGTFAEKDAGFFTNPAPAAASLFAGVILDTFDGKGTITATGIVSIDGNVTPQTETGDLYGEPRLHRNLRGSSFAWRLHRSRLFRHR